MIRCGTAFHFNDRGKDGHLYVVISDPSMPDVVVVSVTTLRPRSADKACVLTAGDCNFVKHDSRIAYEYAELVPSSELLAKASCGEIRLSNTSAES